MNRFNTKQLDGQPIDVDDKSRVVKVCWNKMGVLDLDNDIITQGAFKRTIQQRGPKGANLIWALVDHMPSMKSAYGKPSELDEVGDDLIATIKVAETTLGNDVLKMYQEGLINQQSVGFSIPNKATEERDGVRYIKEVMLYEGSAVLWGANPNTPTLSVGKSLTELKDDLKNRLQLLVKGIRNGSYTDETFIFLEMQEKQILDQIDAIEKATQIATPAPDSVKQEQDLIEAITYFKNKLN